MGWTTKRLSDVTTAIDIDCEMNGEWEQWCLLTADRHLDNPHSDRKLQKLHLDQARERGAFVLDIGDLFDAMQGKNDRRHTKSDLRNEEKTGSYLNALVENATDFLDPYRDLFALITEGNHETSVTKHTEFSLMDALVYNLKRAGSQVLRGGYRGYIKFRFRGPEKSGYRHNKIAYYNHGGGGGGPVTKGVIKTNRRGIMLPDADYVFSGHIHEQWIVNLSRSRLDQKGNEYTDVQKHVQIPSYKEEFSNQPGGWHHEREAPPKPLGAWWIRFYYSNRNRSIEAQFIEAEI